MGQTVFRYFVLVVLTIAFSSGIASAHPMGNFSINHYSRILLKSDSVSIHYILDFAEIPTLQMFGENGSVSVSAEALARNLTLLMNGSKLPLKINSAQVGTVQGDAGLSTTRVTLELSSDWDFQPGLLTFTDDNFAGRIGWKEVVVAADAGFGFPDGNPYTSDISNGLAQYPSDAISQIPDVVRASVRIAPGALNAGTSPAAEPTPRGVAGVDRLAEILVSDTLSPWLLIAGMFVAFSLGAFHALSPGHGKTVVAAFLVGNRGTARHAFFLGAVVTLTHTAGVFLLAIVTLFLSRYIVPEHLYPWMGFLSGLTILSIGFRLFRQRLSGIQDHTHEIPEGITFRNLLALGFSGGIVPCPSALVVLLSAIAVNRIEAGILFILAFSAGLASVLMAIGVVVVRAGKRLDRFGNNVIWVRVLPLISAVLISLVGIGIAIQSIANGSLLQGALSLQRDALVLLSLGLILGLKHATDADHIVAVTTFVSQERGLLRSCWIGVFWGIGHTLSLAIAGLIVIIFKINIPEWVATRLEFVVALMLIGLGGRAILRSLRERFEVGTGVASIETPTSSQLPWHVHSSDFGHAHLNWTQIGLKPLLVGMVHGAAGSAALMLLVLSTIRSPWESFFYIVVFGLGSVLGMLAISFLLALPQHWARRRMAASFRPIPLMAGVFSCLFGLYIGTEIWLSLP